jgi:hypothetical protein
MNSIVPSIQTLIYKNNIEMQLIIYRFLPS